MLNRLVPDANLTYGDSDDLKEICKKNLKRDLLVKDKVFEKHFCSLKFADLQMTFNDGKTDEFILLNNYILAKYR